MERSMESLSERFGCRIGDDIEDFLYTFVNVVMRGKSDEEKADNIFMYLDGDAKRKYKAKFIEGWTLNEAGRDFKKVCQWLVLEFGKKVEPDVLIRDAIHFRLDFSDLSNSLHTLCHMYEKAGFNDRAKYGMLRKAAMEDVRLADFLVLKGPTCFSTLKEMIIQFVKNSETFTAHHEGAVEMNDDSGMDSKRFMERPTVGSAAIESVNDDIKTLEDRLEARFDKRLEMITFQLESLALAVTKAQRSDEGSHCGDPALHAGRFPNNENRNTRNSGKEPFARSEGSPRVEESFQVEKKIDAPSICENVMLTLEIDCETVVPSLDYYRSQSYKYEEEKNCDQFTSASEGEEEVLAEDDETLEERDENNLCSSSWNLGEEEFKFTKHCSEVVVIANVRNTQKETSDSEEDYIRDRVSCDSDQEVESDSDNEMLDLERPDLNGEEDADEGSSDVSDEGFTEAGLDSGIFGGDGCFSDHDLVFADGKDLDVSSVKEGVSQSETPEDIGQILNKEGELRRMIRECLKRNTKEGSDTSTENEIWEGLRRFPFELAKMMLHILFDAAVVIGCDAAECTQAEVGANHSVQPKTDSPIYYRMGRRPPRRDRVITEAFMKLMDLAHTPGFFQKMLNDVLTDIDLVRVYIDDVLIRRRTFASSGVTSKDYTVAKSTFQGAQK